MRAQGRLTERDVKAAARGAGHWGHADRRAWMAFSCWMRGDNGYFLPSISTVKAPLVGQHTMPAAIFEDQFWRPLAS